MSITAVKLNGTNYVLRFKGVEIYLIAQGKEKYLTDATPSKNSKDNSIWRKENTTVMTWLCNSMDLHIASTKMFFDTTKEIWDALRKWYSQSQNNSRIYDLYYMLFFLSVG